MIVWAIQALYRRLREERTRRPLTVAYCWLMLGGIGRANERWLWEIEILVKGARSQPLEVVTDPCSLPIFDFGSPAKSKVGPHLTSLRG